MKPVYTDLYAIGCFGLLSMGLLLRLGLRHDGQRPDKVLIECQPITHTDRTIRVEAEQVTMDGPVTRFYNLEDSSWVETNSPCMTQELGGR